MITDKNKPLNTSGIIIDKIQYWREDNIHAVLNWLREHNGSEKLSYNVALNEYFFESPSGKHMLNKGDYIVIDQYRNFYSYSPRITTSNKDSIFKELEDMRKNLDKLSGDDPLKLSFELSIDSLRDFVLDVEADEN